jgi:hypothetical protein
MKLLRMIILAMTLTATSASLAAITCFTNQPNCAGKAKFEAGNIALACVIWKNDGNGGFTNFTQSAHQVTWYIVGYNDTFQCNAIQNGTPKFGDGRKYILVSAY